MRNIIIFFLIATIATACSPTEKDNGENTSKHDRSVLPPDRELNPFTIKADEPVNAKNLSDEVKRWKEKWAGKTITVYAWMWGGMTPGPKKHFSDVSSPGRIILKVQMAEGVTDSVFAEKTYHQKYVAMEGEIVGHTNALELINCRPLPLFTPDTIPSGEQLTPWNFDKNLVYNPLDVSASIQAWKDVEVTVEDYCSVAMKGNSVRFGNDEGTEVWLKAVFSKNFEGDGQVGLHKIKGKVRSYREGPTVSMGGCEFVDK